MSAAAVIPVRMGARRLPGKPLLLLAGRPIVQWVYDATTASRLFSQVVVATSDEEILDAMARLDIPVIETADSHQTGTDRVAEAAMQLDAHVIANVQGDQPFVTEAMLAALLAPFSLPGEIEMTTVAAPLPVARVDDPDVVKLVCDVLGRAMYFSRAGIPSGASTSHPPLMHIGLYAFTRPFLAAYAQLSATPLEELEKLEQLRVLEHGHRIHVTTVESAPLEINTADDLAEARRRVGQGEA